MDCIDVEYVKKIKKLGEISNGQFKPISDLPDWYTSEKDAQVPYILISNAKEDCPPADFDLTVTWGFYWTHQRNGYDNENGNEKPCFVEECCEICERDEYEIGEAVAYDGAFKPIKEPTMWALPNIPKSILENN